MRINANDSSATSTLPVELANLPLRIGSSLVKAAEGLATDNLSYASVNLMYAADSAAYHYGYFHTVTVALRQFREVLQRSMLTRYAGPADVARGWQRCQQVLLDYVAASSTGTVAA